MGIKMKLWGGRFQANDTSLLDAFNNSITFDYKLYPYDVEGSIAHSSMLCKMGILSEDEKSTIHEGLKSILKDMDEGNFEFKIEHEDIHMNIEAELIARIGEVGKKLHTARSRNDQVALDMRLYARDYLKKVQTLLVNVNSVLLEVSKEHVNTVLPGFTHLQKAQPIRLSFHMMAYFEMFKRDHERLEDCLKRVQVLPLGSGALAGTSYDSDREFLKEALGFEALSENAMDAVSDRDYMIEYINVLSSIMMHLSRISEELIIWSTDEFNYVTLSDQYTTGSSIMPQKKNPDVAELIRGKAGSVYGSQMALMTIMKGLPLAYNKDMQEDKLHMFAATENVMQSLEIFGEMIKTATFNKTVMKKSCETGFINATDAADYLVKKGMPFREAHSIIGQLVLYCVNEKVTLSEVSMAVYKSLSEVFDEDIYEAIDIMQCIESKKSYGSTNYKSIKRMLSLGEKWVCK